MTRARSLAVPVSSAMLVAALVFLLPFESRCQSPAPAPSSPTPPASSTSSPSTNSSTTAQADASQKPAPATKPKHVYTDDDFQPKSSSQSGNGQLGTSENSPYLNCDRACEQSAREKLGWGPDREGEWQIQIIQARRDLIADKQWRELLWNLMQRLTQYCNLQAQESQQVSPSGSDYNSRVARARANQYFENMDRTLRQSLQTAVNGVQSHVQDVYSLEPVRAAMMASQVDRIVDHACELPSHP